MPSANGCFTLQASNPDLQVCDVSDEEPVISNPEREDGDELVDLTDARKRVRPRADESSDEEDIFAPMSSKLERKPILSKKGKLGCFPQSQRSRFPAIGLGNVLSPEGRIASASANIERSSWPTDGDDGDERLFEWTIKTSHKQMEYCSHVGSRRKGRRRVCARYAGGHGPPRGSAQTGNSAVARIHDGVCEASIRIAKCLCRRTDQDMVRGRPARQWQKRWPLST